ncbi:DREAM core complex component lin-52 isoform X1 [Augochlora pura]
MNIMTTEEPVDQPDLICVEESLMSFENLDRASPDLWPEQSESLLQTLYLPLRGSDNVSYMLAVTEVPGVNEFVAQNSPQTEPSSWAASLTADDINHLHQLGNLTMTGLIAEVKKLHDMAYQLGLEEAKEMTRGKYLNIFKHKS